MNLNIADSGIGARRREAPILTRPSTSVATTLRTSRDATATTPLAPTTTTQDQTRKRLNPKSTQGKHVKE